MHLFYASYFIVHFFFYFCKMSSTANRKPSPTKLCEYCGKKVAARGYVSHLRLKHKLKLKEITQVKKTITKVKPNEDGTITQVKRTETITHVKPEKIKNYVPPEAARWGELRCPGCGKMGELRFLCNINDTGDSTNIATCAECRKNLIINHHGYAKWKKSVGL